MDDVKLQELLLKAFPRLATDPVERQRAGRWNRIAYLYYKASQSAQSIADELETSVESVKFALVSMRRVAEGRWANSKGGKKERGVRKRGRPINSLSIPCPLDMQPQLETHARTDESALPSMPQPRASGHEQAGPDREEDEVRMPPES